ncbi:MAG: acetyl-CoA carboxylase biotin carboxyl carrier protein [Peptococcaceae bacterium]|nr:acetyl-CoA carboxylase biotin carboxyl carrier protein [Peptococcaceae bacterium]
MDLKIIQELVKMVDKSKLTTFELEQEGFKIVLKKETEKIVAKDIVPGFWAGGQTPSVNPPAGQTVIEESSKPSEKHPTINSPIVGTFYSSPAPGEEPFVRPGAKVKKGQTLCIIEAMKLMNDIEADDDLQIIDVLVKDGQMVEYGQPLFVVSGT